MYAMTFVNCRNETVTVDLHARHRKEADDIADQQARENGIPFYVVEHIEKPERQEGQYDLFH